MVQPKVGSPATLEMGTHSPLIFFHQVEWGSWNEEYKLEQKKSKNVYNVWCLGSIFVLFFYLLRCFDGSKAIMFEMGCFKGSQRLRRIGMLQRIRPGSPCSSSVAWLSGSLQCTLIAKVFSASSMPLPSSSVSRKIR